MQVPGLGSTEPDARSLGLFLVFVQEVVIVSVESRHCCGLWAQGTPGVLGIIHMPDYRGDLNGSTQH